MTGLVEIVNAKVTLYSTGHIDIDSGIEYQDGKLFFRLGRGRQTPSGNGFIYELKNDVQIWLWNE